MLRNVLMTLLLLVGVVLVANAGEEVPEASFDGATAASELEGGNVQCMVQHLCQYPKNWMDCAAKCDEQAECQKCCARGYFEEGDFDKCIKRCKMTFDLGPADPDDDSLDLIPVDAEVPAA